MLKSTRAPGKRRPSSHPDALTTAAAIALFLQDRRERRLSEVTLDSYARELRRIAVRHAELPRDVAELRALLAERTDKPVSQAGTVRVWRVFYHFLFVEEKIDVDPTVRLHAPKVPKKRQRTLDRADVVRLLDLPLTARDHALLLLMVDCGLRSGELRGLRVRDVHDDWIEVTGKTGQRVIPVHPFVAEACRALGGRPSDPVFRNDRGEALRRERVYKIVRAALADAGLLGSEKNGPHLLRHTVGRSWVASGGSLAGLQAVLGHTTLSTTLIYVSLAAQDVSREHDTAAVLSASQALDAEDSDRAEPYNAAKGGSMPDPTIRAVFDRALTDSAGDERPWWDALADVAPETFLSVALRKLWAGWSTGERGAYLRGRLWNNTDPVTPALCTLLGLPPGSVYGRAVRRVGVPEIPEGVKRPGVLGWPGAPELAVLREPDPDTRITVWAANPGDVPSEIADDTASALDPTGG